ncbi:MAG: hypothetical protein KDA84_25370, partial [Planctomycetaceae bacterium]|nr:hypothetical protein [Planctomycetaceae bacterium]
LSSGCKGPMALQATRQDYNEVVQKTGKEQLLLNLVRLRYRDRITLLEIQSLATQFSFDTAANVQGDLKEATPDILSLGALWGTSERPTISYRARQGSDFVEAMYSPMKPEALVLLTQTGWSASRVFKIGVQEMNGIPNAPSASGPTPQVAPVFQEFNYTVDVLRHLQVADAVDIGFSEETTAVSSSISEKAVDGSDLVAAASNGFKFEKADDGFVLTKKTKKLYLARKEQCDESSLELFNGLGRLDLLSQNRVELKLEPRSVYGAMNYLSHVIDVPEKHYVEGLVPVTYTPDGLPFDWHEVNGDLFRVHVQKCKPRNAYVAVKYRGYWFYIPDDHLSSKATFVLLLGLIQLQAGGGEVGEAPVLTLPVGAR